MTMDKGQDSQDSQSLTKAPGEGDGTSPGQTPETFTKAQHEEALAKAAQKARIDAGRELKTKYEKQLSDSLKAKENQIVELTRRIDEIDNEKYRDDPDGRKALEEKRNLRAERAQLEADRQALDTEKTEHSERLKRADEQEVENRILKSAINHHLDIAKLTEKCQKLGLTTDEAIEEIAETMASASTTKPPETPGLHVDTSKGTGGGEKSYDEQLNERYPTMKT